MHWEDTGLHLLPGIVQKFHCVRLVRLSRPVPLGRLLRLFILFPCRCLVCLRFPLLSIVFPGVQLTERDLDVETCLRVQLVGWRVELLDDRLAWDHGQPFFQHIEHLIEIDVEICLLLRFQLEELFELFLFLVDFKSVHSIFTALFIGKDLIV